MDDTCNLLDGVNKHAYDRYLETEVLSADPIRLVQLLYRGALDAVAAARGFLACGEIKARSQSVSKALNILQELASSLDHQQGGEISSNLAALYDYMQRRLLDANYQQTDGPLVEVEKLLTTLLEAWESCRSSGANANPADVLTSDYAAAGYGSAEYAPAGDLGRESTTAVDYTW